MLKNFFKKKVWWGAYHPACTCPFKAFYHFPYTYFIILRHKIFKENCYRWFSTCRIWFIHFFKKTLQWFESNTPPVKTILLFWKFDLSPRLATCGGLSSHNANHWEQQLELPAITAVDKWYSEQRWSVSYCIKCISDFQFLICDKFVRP